jgi:hypothetical protein
MCGPTGIGFMHSTFEMSSMEPFLGKILHSGRSFVQSLLVGKFSSQHLLLRDSFAKPQFYICYLLSLVMLILPQVVGK